jgi:hypothetical protein
VDVAEVVAPDVLPEVVELVALCRVTRQVRRPELRPDRGREGADTRIRNQGVAGVDHERAFQQPQHVGDDDGRGTDVVASAPPWNDRIRHLLSADRGVGDRVAVRTPDSVSGRPLGGVDPRGQAVPDRRRHAAVTGQRERDRALDAGDLRPRHRPA